ncbi:hypothetical protein [Burkholderia vietnamiensis]|uniref:hypothetical protein n=1 Tax=Burkholderia vietnamiensis TaxID=60552 RepID=UPI001B9601E1|nr:hypothetical protein [Burkholderia vietnamiensis]MBR8010439.1 hypothetical protein [Burkholderia vietnamiensis]
MSDKVLDELGGAVESNRPVVLFLGQRYADAQAKIDPVVATIDEHLGRGDPDATWSTLLQQPLSDEIYPWIVERFERQVPSEALEQVFEVAWSAVFTSSIDPRIVMRLETRGRIPESVLSKDHFPRVPRSRARPGVHYLFGRADETSLETRAPRSRKDLQKRRTVHANPLVNRIPETTTSLGLLVVAGLRADDWLSVDELLAPLSEQPGMRVLWFLAHQERPQSELFDDLVASGNLVTDERSLEEAVLACEIGSGANEAGKAIFQPDAGTITLGFGKFLRLSANLRLRIEAAAAIVDDTWTDPPEPLDKLQLTEAFRRFHGDLVGARGLVEGVGRGFAIERDFEKPLWNQVEWLVQRAGHDESLVIIHGQSGMGKSLAVARLAGKLRRQLHLPVLYSWARVPLAVELDDFCEAAERSGADCTVILCDCNSEVPRYRDLMDGLKSRGRRVIIVGTCYRLEVSDSDSKENYPEALPTLSPQEASAIKSLIARFGQNEEIDYERAGSQVLPMLYRYLAVSRARIIGGINDEARATEALIRLRARNVPRPQRVQSQLAQKLIEAGRAGVDMKIFESDETLAAQGEDAAGRFVDYVMVAGRLDCPVPVNLLLRAIRSVDENLDYTQILYMFDQLDLFRWKMADGEGNDLLVFPRLQLEAELICARRLAGTSREVDCIVELICAARISSVDGAAERDFLLDLLHKMHRDGPRLKKYERGYLDFARALTKLRTRHNVHDASLMLQESAFRRETIFISDGASDPDVRIPDEERDLILEEARDVIEIALNEIASGKLPAGKRTRKNLSVERATIFCYQACGLARRKASAEEVMSHYAAARVAIASAVSTGNSYHPFDIAIWAPALIVKENVLPEEQKQELLADIYSTFDSFSADISLRRYRVDFEERRMKIAQVLRDNELEDSSFEALERLKPAVAYYLRARSICPDVLNATLPVSAAMMRQSDEAANYLEDRYEHIEHDPRGLQLLIQLRWLAVSGERLMRQDRSIIPRDVSFQSKILNYVRTLNELAGSGASNVYRLLEAALQWIVGDSSLAREQFNALARDSNFEDSSRVVRRLLLVSEDPEGYRGTADRLRTEGKWSVSVKNFSGNIDLEVRQFSGEELRKGRELRGFNIAFNFLGPIADPIRFGGKS